MNESSSPEKDADVSEAVSRGWPRRTLKIDGEFPPIKRSDQLTGNRYAEPQNRFAKRLVGTKTGFSFAALSDVTQARSGKWVDGCVHEIAGEEVSEDGQ